MPPAPFSADDSSLMLTEPSPFESSLLNTLSACAVLVPPAPRALSNSAWLIWPLLLLSSCENRSWSALDELVNVEVVDPVDDWLCAASSALMVAGDIGENPFDAEAVVGLADGAALPGIVNGFVEACPNPVVCGDDDFEGSSDWRASSADDAAPRANSMAELRRMPHEAAS